MLVKIKQNAKAIRELLRNDYLGEEQQNMLIELLGDIDKHIKEELY